MNQQGHNAGTHHFPRGLIESAANKRAMRRETSAIDIVGERKFIPSFSLRRPVIETPELVEALDSISTALETTHFTTRDVGRLAMMQFEQRTLVNIFDTLREAPSERLVRGVAGVIAYDIGEQLQEVSPTINIGLREIKPFGNFNSKIGLTPDGWYGLQHNYEEKDRKGNLLPIPILNEEYRLAAGGVCDAFEHVLDFKETFDEQVYELDHHLTVVGRSNKNGFLSHEAFQEAASVVDEFMPHNVTLSDPLMHVWLKRDQRAPLVIRPREHYLEEVS